MTPGPLHKVVQHIRRLAGRPTGTDASDRELLERFTTQRDENAFTALVERHGALVLGVCRRMLTQEQDAEDAFQATFLLLARKAAAVRWHESIGSWLYEAAARIAAKARVRAARRSKHEQQAAPMLSSAPEAVDWRELRGVIDEELQRMPAQFRMPLVLCYLHGQTRDEAAEQLGWSEGMVKGRLERGREMLRQRLTRRGLTLSAALLPALLGQEGVAAVPAALVVKTKEAMRTGIMAAPVADLVKGAVQAMFWSRVQRMVLVLTLIGVLGSGVGVMMFRAEADSKDKSDTRSEAPAKEPDIAWGKATGGLRIGLSPRRLTADPEAKDISIAVWYENTGTENQRVRIDDDANVTFDGVNNSAAFRVSYAVQRLRNQPPKYETLAPGKKMSLRFTLPFGGKAGGWAGLPELAAGESLCLRAGVSGEGADRLTEPRKSGMILVTRPLPASVKPMVIGPDADGKTVAVEVGCRIEIRLPGNTEGAGWEAKGNPVVLKPLRREFEPKADASAPDIGTFVFIYEAAEEGEATIRVDYVAPSGPVPPKARDATQLIQRFKVIIKITARG